MKKSILIAFAVMFIAVAHSASGAGYAYEPFTDPAFGPLSGQGQWAPGSSWYWVSTTTAALTYDPVGLTYKSLKTAPGAATITTTMSGNAHWGRDLATTYSAVSDDYWMSFLLRPTEGPPQGFTMMSPGGSDGGGFGYHWSDTLKFTNSTDTGIVGQAGVTNFIVLHYIDNWTIDLWVDPVLSPVPSAPLLTETPPAWTGGVVDFSLVKFVTNAASDGLGGSFTVDEIRLGQSWEAVTVPEPATFSLLGIGLLALLRRRK